MATGESPIVVLRCRACGDTYPATGAEQACPSCGCLEADLATEPLL